MIKNTDLVTETLRDSKHPFRATADRPGTAQKHRYERRKARGILKTTDWTDEIALA